MYNCLHLVGEEEEDMVGVEVDPVFNNNSSSPTLLPTPPASRKNIILGIDCFMYCVGTYSPLKLKDECTLSMSKIVLKKGNM